MLFLRPQRLGIPNAHPPASYTRYKSSCLWVRRVSTASLRKTFRPQDSPGTCVQGPMPQEEEATTSSSFSFDPGHPRRGACCWKTMCSPEFSDSLLLPYCHHSHSIESI